MRNPRLWRNVGLALMASGPIAIAAALQLPPGALTDAPRAIGFIFGVMAILFGGIGALVMHLGARAQAALEHDEEVIARWRVDAATWRDFIALN
ncbi:MAG TPA: hypothetical protein VKM00_08580, partial [Luteimonas sp.]|nr:hypothetical protein [Luteimonas sp.]